MPETPKKIYIAKNLSCVQYRCSRCLCYITRTMYIVKDLCGCVPMSNSRPYQTFNAYINAIEFALCGEVLIEKFICSLQTMYFSDMCIICGRVAMGFWYAGELLQNLNLTYEGCSVRLIGKIKLLINPLHGTPTPRVYILYVCKHFRQLSNVRLMDFRTSIMILLYFCFNFMYLVAPQIIHYD